MTSSIDRRIEEALGSHPVAEPDLRDMVGDLFASRMRWLNVLSMVFTLVIFGLAVFCGYRLFEATEPVGALQWGVGTLLCMNAVGMLKLWFFMVINRNTVLREIKRLELRIAAGAQA